MGAHARLTISMLTISFMLIGLASISEARRGGRGPNPGKNNCRLDHGKIKMDGWPVLDQAGVQVATKRVTILWRYVDANCDGVMTWGAGPADGSDYLRIVPRTIYDFTAAVTPARDANNQVQLTTHHFGPLDALTGTFRTTSFREVHHDDLIPGQPAPGDFIVTQGMDGLPIPGLSLGVNLFTDSGNAVFVPGAATTWGAKFVLTVDPLISNGTIPAGAFIFLDSQLNVYDIVPGADGTCEFGFAEEDWINANGGGAIQAGPNTAAPANVDVKAVPILFAPQCSNAQ